MNIQSMYEEIIDLAISKENEAIDLFNAMAASSQRPSARALFKRLTKMEKAHKKY